MQKHRGSCPKENLSCVVRDLCEECIIKFHHYVGAESFSADGKSIEERCEDCELPISYCDRLRGVRHAPREGGSGRYALDCDRCGEMYESCPECNGDICFDCHNDVCIFCGCNTLKYAAESFSADLYKGQPCPHEWEEDKVKDWGDGVFTIYVSCKNCGTKSYIEGHADGRSESHPSPNSPYSEAESFSADEITCLRRHCGGKLKPYSFCKECDATPMENCSCEVTHPKYEMKWICNSCSKQYDAESFSAEGPDYEPNLLNSCLEERIECDGICRDGNKNIAQYADDYSDVR